jgi:hypothetical protein
MHLFLLQLLGGKLFIAHGKESHVVINGRVMSGKLKLDNLDLILF